jgi:hypothetical protein
MSTPTEVNAKLPFGLIYKLWNDINSFVNAIVQQLPDQRKSEWYEAWCNIYTNINNLDLLPMISLHIITNKPNPTLLDSINELESMILYLPQHFSYDIVDKGTLTTIDYALPQFVAFTRTTDVGTMQKLNDKSDDKLDFSDDDLIDENENDVVAIMQEEKNDDNLDLIKSPNLKQITLTQEFTVTREGDSTVSPTKSGNESSFGDDSGLSFDPSFPGKENVTMKKIKQLEKLFWTQDWI